MFVPVRHNHCGTLTLRIGRLDNADRVGLAFTSQAALIATLGQGQPWTQIDLEELRELLEPIGITQIRIDPLPAVMVAAAA
jgi:hypothetical protein